ncbi:hypothetical protein COW36_09150 [bacterium (Candidatus Blackallbacteria) CG17_big_fil_post_rev_8_21_14_2_50_48_46]|uniref:Uncharacterized protein n=1 Tax=bacterium (Candidatus Blackallbacteria) CG17_big_fil_post_rev_8_21_14_2_50_48_46 TaxID=2014261 RepID=A0A2M7G5Y6_9BACT|nr:MAG: hypothetical protein COW64_23900 [bacterium (Candidatus Blackallbacteria) CG18_big_fil_WC_8_21_14_2_50_49_26]PIW17332.1 MAG: hypothetical protein COW36_09150 [bacterium (Candidatus Blackallbacteria) CG17_big_fil_post_rev_8_21_14_2_50_48_46]PIW47436.1 MAG: hypothetical protein COW20_12680 [bacterium (Candidatus Blackallbacteria) CG13_big_fil_rev_8_21_14_2_50_49_14]
MNSPQFEPTAVPNIYKHLPTNCFCFYSQLTTYLVRGVGVCLFDSIDAAQQAESAFRESLSKREASYAH